MKHSGAPWYAHLLASESHFDAMTIADSLDFQVGARSPLPMTRGLFGAIVPAFGGSVITGPSMLAFTQVAY